MGLYKVQGELGRFMNGSFKTLCITPGLRVGANNAFHKPEDIEGPKLWTKHMEAVRSFVLTGGGESSLTTIFLGSDMYEEEEKGDKIKEFRKSCPNITSLRTGERGAAWVTMFGKDLQLLVITNITPWYIAKCCPDLRELFLTMNCDEYVSYRSWAKLGGNLESRSLSMLKMCVVEIGKKKHCRNIRKPSRRFLRPTEAR